MKNRLSRCGGNLSLATFLPHSFGVLHCSGADRRHSLDGGCADVGGRGAFGHGGIRPRSISHLRFISPCPASIYSAWTVFILPGIALLSRSWPVLLTPLVAYTVFKLSIRREDEYLQQRFGDAYPEYRARVNELIPVPNVLASAR